MILSYPDEFGEEKITFDTEEILADIGNSGYGEDFYHNGIVEALINKINELTQAKDKD